MGTEKHKKSILILTYKTFCTSSCGHWLDHDHEDQLYNFSELCDIILGLKQLKIKVQTYEGNRKETSTSTHVACEVKVMSS